MRVRAMASGTNVFTSRRFHQSYSRMSGFRIEHDSMGEVQVPASALYQAQTQRAANNFPYGPRERLPPSFLAALARLKSACSSANFRLGLLDEERDQLIRKACQQVTEQLERSESCEELSESEQAEISFLIEQFPLSIFQTGSGTSSNMNMNEVIASLCAAFPGNVTSVHPNDHVNMSQSSNDTIPSAINLSAFVACRSRLLPALQHLQTTIEQKAAATGHVITTGRTHLMDAMPISYGQILGGWAAQIRKGRERIEDSLRRVGQLAIGGTAVGTGVNADPRFAGLVCEILSADLGLKESETQITQNDNLFEAISASDAAVELSGQLKTVAASLMKISNDLRWMNSGPIAGLQEISLPSLQPGSSIMPGKINPVVPESVCMVCAQVMGNDVAITIGGQAGNFQLNVMLPLIVSNLLRSIQLLSVASTILADSAIEGFTVNEEHISGLVSKNPVLVTALNPVIGYELGAKIAKTAYQSKRALKDVAREMTLLSDAELDRLLDPALLIQGGVNKLE